MKILILIPLKKVKTGKNLQKIFPVLKRVSLHIYTLSLARMVRNKYNSAASNSHLLKAFPLALKRGDEPFCRVPL
jgi:hypothetical protein